MAKIASVNVDCATNGGAAAIWNLIDLLVNGGAGWTKIAESDGSGNPVTSAATLDITSAYVVIQEPTGTHAPGTAARRYFFQRGASSHLWWVRYMRSNAAIAGGTNTVMPFPTPNTTLTIENLVGTSATGAALFNNSGGSDTRNYLTHAVAYTTPYGAGAVPGDSGAYFFTLFCTIRVTGAVEGVCCALPLTQPAAGDADPVIIFCAPNPTRLDSPLGAGVRSAYYRFGTVGAIFIGHLSGSPGFWTSNPYNGADNLLGPVFYRISTGEPKGYTDLCLQTGTNRAYPNTINLNTNAFVYTNFQLSIPFIVFPWPNGVTPVV
jgi:hypothetical protein